MLLQRVYFTFMPAAVINNLNKEENANSANTLPNQIAAIQPSFFHQGERRVVSVIALVWGNFSSEDIVTPIGINQNNRDNE